MNPRVKRGLEAQKRVYSEDRSRVASQANWLQNEGYYFFPDSTCPTKWYAVVWGPEGTVDGQGQREESFYEGIPLLIRITFSGETYPFTPPTLENMLPFKRRFNENLWGCHDEQSLMTSSGHYQTYKGLICMDILNTPHVRVEHGQEIYDKEREAYTPLLKISNILLSLRSNVMDDETRLSCISDQILQLILFRDLVGNFFLGNTGLTEEEQADLWSQTAFQEMSRAVFQRYQKHYLKTLDQLTGQIESDQLSELHELLETIKQRFT